MVVCIRTSTSRRRSNDWRNGFVESRGDLAVNMSLEKKKGGITATASANIDKQKLKVQKIHHRLDNIRTDYINKTIAEIVKTKPSYITIEDLNVSGMMKNKHLSKAVASQKLYEFRAKLKAKCDDNGIELSRKI